MGKSYKTNETCLVKRGSIVSLSEKYEIAQCVKSVFNPHEQVKKLIPVGLFEGWMQKRFFNNRLSAIVQRSRFHPLLLLV